MNVRIDLIFISAASIRQIAVGECSITLAPVRKEQVSEEHEYRSGHRDLDLPAGGDKNIESPLDHSHPEPRTVRNPGVKRKGTNQKQKGGF